MSEWIKTKDRFWTEAEREAGVWIWEGNFPLLNHRVDEQPRRLPRWSENPPGGSWASGAYASEWMPAVNDIMPERPRPPSPTLPFP